MIARLTRRELILAGAAGLLSATVASQAPAAPPAPADPVAIVTAIYTRVAKGKGDGGGGFVFENKAAKAKYLSKSLTKLWAEADAHTPKDDVGPIDFDPVTNSQDPDVKSFKVAPEKLEADIAVVAVTIAGARRAASLLTASSATASCARTDNGKSTTSAAPVMVSHGRSVGSSRSP